MKNRVNKTFLAEGEGYYVCVEDNGDRGFFEPSHCTMKIIPKMLFRFADLKESNAEAEGSLVMKAIAKAVSK